MRPVNAYWTGVYLTVLVNFLTNLILPTDNVAVLVAIFVGVVLVLFIGSQIIVHLARKEK